MGRIITLPTGKLKADKMRTLLIKTLCLLTAIGLLTTNAWAAWTIQDETGVAVGGFALQEGSPCVDGGTTLASEYNLDFDGVLRPSRLAWDIGAFELTGGAPIIETEYTGQGFEIGGAEVR